MPKKKRDRNTTWRKNQQAPSKVKRAEERKQKRLEQFAEQEHHPDVAVPSGIGDLRGQAQQLYHPHQEHGRRVPPKSAAATAAPAGPSGIGNSPRQAQVFYPPFQEQAVPLDLDPDATSIQGQEENNKERCEAGSSVVASTNISSRLCWSRYATSAGSKVVQSASVFSLEADRVTSNKEFTEDGNFLGFDIEPSAAEKVPLLAALTMPVKVAVMDKQVQVSPTVAMKETQTSSIQIIFIGVQADQRRNSIKTQKSKLQILMMKYHNMTSDEKFACLLYSKVKRNLPGAWVVTRVKEKVHLLFMQQDDSVSIVKSISFFDNKIFIRILGHPLKYVHSLWDKISFEFELDLSSLCSTLLTLAEEVENMKECCGCSDLKYLDLWSMGAFSKRGAVEFGLLGKKLYRSNNCELLLSQSAMSSCLSCRSEQAKMASHLNRAKKREANRRYEAKMNIQYMERNQLAKALRETRTLNSKLKIEVQTLKKKVDFLIKAKMVSR